MESSTNQLNLLLPMSRYQSSSLEIQNIINEINQELENLNNILDNNINDDQSYKLPNDLISIYDYVETNLTLDLTNFNSDCNLCITPAVKLDEMAPSLNLTKNKYKIKFKFKIPSLLYMNKSNKRWKIYKVYDDNYNSLRNSLISSGWIEVCHAYAGQYIKKLFQNGNDIDVKRALMEVPQTSSTENWRRLLSSIFEYLRCPGSEGQKLRTLNVESKNLELSIFQESRKPNLLENTSNLECVKIEILKLDIFQSESEINLENRILLKLSNQKIYFYQHNEEDQLETAKDVEKNTENLQINETAVEVLKKPCFCMCKKCGKKKSIPLDKSRKNTKNFELKKTKPIQAIVESERQNEPGEELNEGNEITEYTGENDNLTNQKECSTSNGHTENKNDENCVKNFFDETENLSDHNVKFLKKPKYAIRKVHKHYFDSPNNLNQLLNEFSKVFRNSNSSNFDGKVKFMMPSNNLSRQFRLSTYLDLNQLMSAQEPSESKKILQLEINGHRFLITLSSKLKPMLEQNNVLQLRDQSEIPSTPELRKIQVNNARFVNEAPKICTDIDIAPYINKNQNFPSTIQPIGTIIRALDLIKTYSNEIQFNKCLIQLNESGTNGIDIRIYPDTNYSAELNEKLMSIKKLVETKGTSSKHSKDVNINCKENEALAVAKFNHPTESRNTGISPMWLKEISKFMRALYFIKLYYNEIPLTKILTNVTEFKIKGQSLRLYTDIIPSIIEQIENKNESNTKSLVKLVDCNESKPIQLNIKQVESEKKNFQTESQHKIEKKNSKIESEHEFLLKKGASSITSTTGRTFSFIPSVISNNIIPIISELDLPKDNQLKEIDSDTFFIKTNTDETEVVENGLRKQKSLLKINWRTAPVNDSKLIEFEFRKSKLKNNFHTMRVLKTNKKDLQPKNSTDLGSTKNIQKPTIRKHKSPKRRPDLFVDDLPESKMNLINNIDLVRIKSTKEEQRRKFNAAMDNFYKHSQKSLSLKRTISKRDIENYILAKLSRETYLKKRLPNYCQTPMPRSDKHKSEDIRTPTLKFLTINLENRESDSSIGSGRNRFSEEFYVSSETAQKQRRGQKKNNKKSKEKKNSTSKKTTKNMGRTVLTIFKKDYFFDNNSSTVFTHNRKLKTNMSTQTDLESPKTISLIMSLLPSVSVSTQCPVTEYNNNDGDSCKKIPLSASFPNNNETQLPKFNSVSAIQKEARFSKKKIHRISRTKVQSFHSANNRPLINPKNKWLTELVLSVAKDSQDESSLDFNAAIDKEKGTRSRDAQSILSDSSQRKNKTASNDLPNNSATSDIKSNHTNLSGSLKPKSILSNSRYYKKTSVDQLKNMVKENFSHVFSRKNLSTLTDRLLKIERENASKPKRKDADLTALSSTYTTALSNPSSITTGGLPISPAMSFDTKYIRDSPQVNDKLYNSKYGSNLTLKTLKTLYNRSIALINNAEQNEQAQLNSKDSLSKILRESVTSRKISSTLKTLFQKSMLSIQSQYCSALSLQNIYEKDLNRNLDSLRKLYNDKEIETKNYLSDSLRNSNLNLMDNKGNAIDKEVVLNSDNKKLELESIKKTIDTELLDQTNKSISEHLEVCSKAESLRGKVIPIARIKKIIPIKNQNTKYFKGNEITQFMSIPENLNTNVSMISLKLRKKSKSTASCRQKTIKICKYNKKKENFKFYKPKMHPIKKFVNLKDSVFVEIRGQKVLINDKRILDTFLEIYKKKIFAETLCSKA